MNTVDPIVTRLSEVIGKIIIDSNFLDENADFGHFSLFLAFLGSGPKGDKVL